jgi:hypothetical protein
MIAGALLATGIQAAGPPPKPESGPLGGSLPGDVRDLRDSSESSAIDVTALPRLCLGTVVNAERLPLFIDGEPASGVSAKVVAGLHSIAIGSRANVHSLDVPCDAAVAVR